MSLITPPMGTPARLFSWNAIGYSSQPCAAGVTRTVVEQVATHCLVSMTRSRIEWAPDPNVVVKLTVAAVGGPPAATRLVRTVLPSTDKTTTNSSPSASVTWTDTVATKPVEELASNVAGVGQRTVGVVLLSSYAPMSITPRTIRGRPRWSVSGASVLSPASMAGLPQRSACVNVRPPLSCSGPSFNSTPVILNRSFGPGEIRTFVLPIKLKPPEATVSDSTLKRSKRAAFPATIEFFSSSDPTLSKTAQPGCRDPSPAMLAVTVLWFNVIVLPPTLKSPPLATASAGGVPAPGVAELPLRVLFSRVTVPSSLAMPAP